MDRRAQNHTSLVMTPLRLRCLVWCTSLVLRWEKWSDRQHQQETDTCPKPTPMVLTSKTITQLYILFLVLHLLFILLFLFWGWRPSQTRCRYDGSGHWFIHSGSRNGCFASATENRTRSSYRLQSSVFTGMTHTQKKANTFTQKWKFSYPQAIQNVD